MLIVGCEDIGQWDHEMVVEFLRARNVFGRRRAEELVGSVELREMKGIVRIGGEEEEAVIVNEEWLSRVSAGRRKDGMLIRISPPGCGSFSRSSRTRSSGWQWTTAVF